MSSLFVYAYQTKTLKYRTTTQIIDFFFKEFQTVEQIGSDDNAGAENWCRVILSVLSWLTFFYHCTVNIFGKTTSCLWNIYILTYTYRISVWLFYYYTLLVKVKLMNQNTSINVSGLFSTKTGRNLVISYIIPRFILHIYRGQSYSSLFNSETTNSYSNSK